MRSKIFFVVASTILAACAYAGGPRPPKNLKIYEIKTGPAWCSEPWCQGKVGLFRAQDQEHKSFDEADGFFAMSKETLRAIQQSCPKP